MVEEKKFRRFCPHYERYLDSSIRDSKAPQSIAVSFICSVNLMIGGVEEADSFEEDVQTFGSFLRRLFHVRNLLLMEGVLSEHRGKSRMPRALIFLLKKWPIHLDSGSALTLYDNLHCGFTQ